MNQATSRPMPEITATELKQRMDNGDDIQLIDVREADEVAIATHSKRDSYSPWDR